MDIFVSDSVARAFNTSPKVSGSSTHAETQTVGLTIYVNENENASDWGHEFQRSTIPMLEMRDGTFDQTSAAWERPAGWRAHIERIWLFRRICGFKGRAWLRLDRRVIPPTFIITSPRLGEGEVMVKVGRNAAVRASTFRGETALTRGSSSWAGSTGTETDSSSRRRAHPETPSAKTELPRFVKTGSAPECVSRQSSIAWRSSSRLSTAAHAWRNKLTVLP
jgi:hypothetical protein